jgi:putative transcriptional regulator
MPKKTKKRRLGERLVEEFTELRDTLRSGQPIEKKFTVRTVELDLQPKEFDPESVRMIRLKLGVSQAVFARIMGVSTDLVASWEQGHRNPVPMACRLLELIDEDRRRWICILEHAMNRKTSNRS